MEKILVSLEIPVISEKYDIYIPKFYNVGELIPLIAKAVEDISHHRYVSSGQEFLCVRENNLLLRQEETLESYGVENGDHLILL